MSQLLLLLLFSGGSTASAPASFGVLWTYVYYALVAVVTISMGESAIELFLHHNGSALPKFIGKSIAATIAIYAPSMLARHFGLTILTADATNPIPLVTSLSSSIYHYMIVLASGLGVVLAMFELMKFKGGKNQHAFWNALFLILCSIFVLNIRHIVTWFISFSTTASPSTIW